MAYLNGKEILFSPNVRVYYQYDEGYSDGYLEGGSNFIKLQNEYDICKSLGITISSNGFPTNVLASWDTHWNNFQKSGSKTDYSSTDLKANSNSFTCWQSEYIIPKYPIRPKKAWAMFYKCPNLIEAPEIDLSGVTDWVISGTSGCNNLFDQCKKLKRVGVLDVRNTSLRGAFSECNALESVEKMIVSENTFFKNTFSACYELKEIRFEGILSATRTDDDYGSTTQADYGFSWNLDLAYSTKLSKDSIISLFECTRSGTGYIRDMYYTAIGSITIALSLEAVNKAFETSSGANNGSSSSEWQELVARADSYYIVLR